MIEEVTIKDKLKFNDLATHPLQSWEWGDFRKSMGLKVLRLGRLDHKKNLREIAQISIHSLPFNSYTIGYFPRGSLPSSEMIKQLMEVGKQYKSIFLKLEPNIKKEEDNMQSFTNSSEFYIKQSPHPLFTKYTFQLDLTKSEEDLLKMMHPKTRYNIKIAQKHGVTVKEDNSSKAFEEYLRLSFETTKRQKFYAHNEDYHRKMWKTLQSCGIAHLLTARYKGEILVTWIVFLFNQALYYPYGASSTRFKNVMASNLMMWEAIKFGQRSGARLFDMWGALGPEPNQSDSWYGFHKFKEGYSPTLVEFVGSYDLIINKILYRAYNHTYNLRRKVLKIQSYL